MRFVAFIAICLCVQNSYSQSIDKSYDDYDFVAGEKIIFEDGPSANKNEKPLSKWKTEGEASVINYDSTPCFSINAYYTKLEPQMFGGKKVPDSITIEYDTWLDHGYDGNPGIEVQIRNNDDVVNITPNKHAVSVSYPESGTATKDNPEEYFGENKFYDRWVHISISQFHKHLTVYLDHYKMIDIPDDKVIPKSILVTGNRSGEMKILMKNFRVATGIPQKLILTNGKFVTHAIRFDVDKSELKPESIVVIRELADYLKAHPSDKFEVGGHTDNDGTPDHNLKLSQQRAEAVVDQLTSMGIDKGRLVARGYGATKPVDPKPTAEAKAFNRRVEFTKI